MYYPSGGWRDFQGDFETRELALIHALEVSKDGYQVVDTTTMEIVLSKLSASWAG